MLISAACIPVVAGIVVLAQAPQPQGRALALTGATVIVDPDAAPIRDGVVLIEAGAITAVGERANTPIPHDAAVLDCSGRTITAGFHNSHVHFFQRKWASAAAIPADELGRQIQDMLTRYGFTSVFDLGSPGANTRVIRGRIESGEVPGPRIRTTGEAIIAPGAMPSERILGILGFMAFPAPEVADEAQASAAAARLLDEGADGIKIHLQPPPPPGSPIAASAIAAAVGEAHRRGRPVFVHPNSNADVLAALRAGVDVIAHTTPGSDPWGEEIIAAMKQRDAALTPTLSLWMHIYRHDRLSSRDRMVDTAVGQLRAWVEAGGTVLFGSDLGAAGDDPADEYALMADAGMTWRQILDSLTTAPAARFGDADRLGRVAPGFQADLVVLRGDPSEDILALADVRYTLRAGTIIYRADD